MEFEQIDEEILSSEFFEDLFLESDPHTTYKYDEKTGVATKVSDDRGKKTGKKNNTTHEFETENKRKSRLRRNERAVKNSPHKWKYFDYGGAELNPGRERLVTAISRKCLGAFSRSEIRKILEDMRAKAFTPEDPMKSARRAAEKLDGNYNAGKHDAPHESSSRRYFYVCVMNYVIARLKKEAAKRDISKYEKKEKEAPKKSKNVEKGVKKVSLELKTKKIKKIPRLKGRYGKFVRK